MQVMSTVQRNLAVSPTSSVMLSGGVRIVGRPQTFTEIIPTEQMAQMAQMAQLLSAEKLTYFVVYPFPNFLPISINTHD